MSRVFIDFTVVALARSEDNSIAATTWRATDGCFLAVPAKAVQVVWAKTIPGGAKKTIQTNTGRIDIPKNRGLLPRRFFRARLRYGFISAYKDTTGAENFT